MAKNHGEDLGWELGVDFPEWGNTEIYVKTISKEIGRASCRERV